MAEGNQTVETDVKYSYLYLPVMNIIYLEADGIIYFKSKEQHWFWSWKNRKFDNRNMALKLIEILYEKQFINEATYNQIMKNNHYINQYSD